MEKKLTLRTNLNEAPEDFKEIIKMLRKLKLSQAKLKKTIKNI